MIDYSTIVNMTSCRVGVDVDDVQFLMNTYFKGIKNVLSSGDASVIKLPNFGKFKIAKSQLQKEYNKLKKNYDKMLMVYNDHPSDSQKFKMDFAKKELDLFCEKFMEKYDVEYIEKMNNNEKD